MASPPIVESGEAPVHTKAAATPPYRSWWWGALAILVVGLWPMVELVRLVAQSGHTTNLWADIALLDLNARRAWHLDQLLGPYSRFGWHHPGPFLVYLLALPVRLFEPNGTGIYVGTVLINGAVAMAAVSMMWRRASALAALWASVAVAGFSLSLTMDFLQLPWNPYLVVLPLVLFCVLWADALQGQPGSLAWAAVVASYLIQTDIGVAPFCVLMIVVAVMAFGVHWWRSRNEVFVRQRTSGLIGLVVFLVCWIPSVVELWRDSPNNLTLLWRYFTSYQGTMPPLSVALHQSLIAMTVLPFGYDNLWGQPLARSDTEVLLGCIGILLIASAAVAIGWRRRQTLALTLTGAGGLAVVVGVFSTSRVTGTIYSYVIIWQSVVPCVFVLALGLAMFGPAGDWVGARSSFGQMLDELKMPNVRVLSGVAGLVVVAALVLVPITVWKTLDLTPVWKLYPNVGVLTNAAQRVLRPSDHWVNLTLATGAVEPDGAGLVDGLERDGHQTTVSPADYVLEYGHERKPDRPVSVRFDLYQQGDQAAAKAFGGTIIARSGGEVLAYTR